MGPRRVPIRRRTRSTSPRRNSFGRSIYTILQELCRQRTLSHGIGGDYRLEGEVGVKLLGQILETGRCRLETLDGPVSPSGQGEARQADSTLADICRRSATTNLRSSIACPWHRPALDPAPLSRSRDGRDRADRDRPAGARCGCFCTRPVGQAERRAQADQSGRKDTS